MEFFFNYFSVFSKGWLEFQVRGLFARHKMDQNMTGNLTDLSGNSKKAANLS
jgi:hypothetical protein